MSENRRKLLFIIDKYGTKHQEDIAIEELSELQKAILKHRRKRSGKRRKKVIDEIADVSVMLEQLKIIYSCHKEVAERMDYKIERQIKRIKKKYNIETRKEINTRSR